MAQRIPQAHFEEKTQRTKEKIIQIRFIKIESFS